MRQLNKKNTSYIYKYIYRAKMDTQAVVVHRVSLR